MVYKVDGISFESKEIADAWYEELNKVIRHELRQTDDGFFLAPPHYNSSFSMPGYAAFIYRNNINDFNWLLEKAKKRLAGEHLCDKCKGHKNTDKIKVDSIEIRELNLCHECQTALLNCMFSWRWSSDVIQAIDTVEEFMKCYPDEDEEKE